MALSGVHIEFGYSSGVTVAGTNTPLLMGLFSSQDMATTAASTISAPGPNANSQPVISIWASAPIYFALGPNITVAAASVASLRRYFDGSGRFDLVVNPGDKFAWVAA